MKIKKLLNIGYEKVNNKNDVRDLLVYLSGNSFEELVINYDNEASKEIEELFMIYIKQLEEGYPLAYITGYRCFYGRNFKVTPDVLIPREETEMIIDIALNESWDSALDMCAGSGIIGITLGLETSKPVTLSDVSLKALDIARENAELLGADVDIVASDIFSMVEGKFDIIVSNPPYIKKSELEKLDLLKSEPYSALYGGDDGLYFYDMILRDAKDYLNEKGIIIFEIGYNQMSDVKCLAKKYGYRVDGEYKDNYGLDRFIKVSS